MNALADLQIRVKRESQNAPVPAAAS